LAPPASSHHIPRPGNGAILVVTLNGTIRWADPEARRYLKEFFGPPAASGTVPQKIARWIATLDLNRRSKSLIVSRHDRHLLVSQRHPRSAMTIVLWLEVSETRRYSSHRKHGSLTAREDEVLYWLGQGKANSEIGAILGIASSTVNKHLERVYPKLGVDNRTAASNVAATLRDKSKRTA
jgi:DNA-binding CsgD family transcriptional regulator